MAGGEQLQNDVTPRNCQTRYGQIKHAKHRMLHTRPRQHRTWRAASDEALESVRHKLSRRTEICQVS
eukprot:5267742-Pleurochrysis_carterae.AAC.2